MQICLNHSNHGRSAKKEIQEKWSQSNESRLKGSPKTEIIPQKLFKYNLVID